MIVKLLTEHYLVFVNSKGGCTGSSESTIVKMPHCWKSHATAHLIVLLYCSSWMSHSFGFNGNVNKHFLKT